MKTFAAFLLFAGFALSARAAPTAPRLDEDNWIVGGSTSLSFAKGTSSVFSLSPELECFVIDNIAVGASASFQTQPGFSELSLAPEITFHMRAGETTIPYLTVRPIQVTTFTGISPYYSSVGIFGVKFFLTDSVALGPAVRWTHYWPQKGTLGSDSGAFLGVFSMHI